MTKYLSLVFLILLSSSAYSTVIKVFPGHPIQAAIDGAQAGDVIELQNGIHNISSSIRILRNHITLRGQSHNAVVSYSNNIHGILVGNSTTPVNNVRVETMTIDGNRDIPGTNLCTTSGAQCVHGVRLERASHLVLNNLIIKNVKRYGIGLQGDGEENGDNQFSDILIKKTIIHNTGGDGIDLKHVRNSSYSGILIRDMAISQFGLDVPNQAGIDVRGFVKLGGELKITDFSSDEAAVRFRDEPVGSENGLSADGSELDSKLIIDGHSRGGKGIVVGADDVIIQLDNGSLLEFLHDGIVVDNTAVDTTISGHAISSNSGSTIRSNTYGIQVLETRKVDVHSIRFSANMQAAVNISYSDDVIVRNSDILGSNWGVRVHGDDNLLDANTIVGNDYGIRVRAESNGTVIEDNLCFWNLNNIEDQGNSTVIIGNSCLAL